MSDINELLVQGELEMRRGVLVMGVLATLSNPTYGYALIQALEEKGLSIEGNTLYPLLRRLEKQGLLESKWEVETQKPRKYYEITKSGSMVLEGLKGIWLQMVNQMNEILEKGE